MKDAPLWAWTGTVIGVTVLMGLILGCPMPSFSTPGPSLTTWNCFVYCTAEDGSNRLLNEVDGIEAATVEDAQNIAAQHSGFCFTGETQSISCDQATSAKTIVDLPSDSAMN